MIQGILIGLGAGMAAYWVGSLVFRGMTSGWTSSGPPDKNLDASLQSSASVTAQGGLQWFLVRSKQGHVRLVRARSKTSKTVAGPFATKEAAVRAKERPDTWDQPLPVH